LTTLIDTLSPLFLRPPPSLSHPTGRHEPLTGHMWGKGSPIHPNQAAFRTPGVGGLAEARSAGNHSFQSIPLWVLSQDFRKGTTSCFYWVWRSTTKQNRKILGLNTRTHISLGSTSPLPARKLIAL
jgi:hypothetical protein